MTNTWGVTDVALEAAGMLWGLVALSCANHTIVGDGIVEGAVDEETHSASLRTAGG